MPVAASPSTPGAPGNFSVIASVTSADTVTVSVCGTGTPTASTYIVSVEAGFTTSHGSTSSTPDKKLASASLDASVTTEDSDKTIASEIVVPCCLVAPGNGSAPGATSGWTYVSGSFSIASGGPGGREIAFHRNGKFDNLSVCINTPQPSSGSLIITLQIGVWQGMLSSTSQKLIIPAGSTVGCYTAPGAAAVYTAGQAAVYYITNNASGSSAELGTIYQEFDNAH
jgi:hypothetical protein